QSAIPQFGQQTPLGRAGQPVELSGTYVLLASEDSSYTTGQVFGVTGGTQID
ncbi:SDR family oxidoreductase, partial [Staphylococcus epidermidis]